MAWKTGLEKVKTHKEEKMLCTAILYKTRENVDLYKWSLPLRTWNAYVIIAAKEAAAQRHRSQTWSLGGSSGWR